MNSASGQTNTGLSKYIDSLATVDQKWRSLLTKITNGKVDTISKFEVVKNINLTDSLNFIQIKRIFKLYGYLGYRLVGKESSHNFWILVQHADIDPSFQDSVLKKMKIEADSANASLAEYAYLTDRVKVNTGQLQIYGTQMMLNATKSSYVIKPTIEPESLNERRKSVGLKPIEDYIKLMNERYFGTLKQ